MATIRWRQDKQNEVWIGDAPDGTIYQVWSDEDSDEWCCERLVLDRAGDCIGTKRVCGRMAPRCSEANAKKSCERDYQRMTRKDKKPSE